MTTEGQYTEALKPCLFCGGKAESPDNTNYIGCGSKECPASAICISPSQWNTRVESAQPHEAFQSRVKPWMDACFGPAISADKVERNHRFLEEALELVQACGATASECHQLADYVFNRPVGEPNQESGGVMVTHAALCLANGLDMHASGETELTRVWGKIEKIRAKQAGKPKHSPLPEDAAQSESGSAKVPDYKRLAYEFAELLGFCMERLRPVGTGLILDCNSGKTEPWRNWIARYIEKLPDMKIDHDVLEALDLPAKARRKRLAEIATDKAKPIEQAPKAGSK